MPTDLSSAERIPRPIPTPPPNIDNQLTSDRVLTKPSALSSKYGRKQLMGRPRLERPNERIGVEYDNQCLLLYS